MVGYLENSELNATNGFISEAIGTASSNEQSNDIAESPDLFHAKNIAITLAARQSEIERIIADLPPGTDVDSLKQQSAHIGGMIGQINSSIANGDFSAAMIVASQANNVIGVSRTESNEAKDKEKREKAESNRLSYMEASAIASGGALAATTVLSFDELVKYSQKRVENIQDELDKKYKNVDSATKSDQAFSTTASIKDVYKDSAKEIADLKQKINDMDVPQEEKDKLIKTLDKLEKASSNEISQSAQTTEYIDEISARQEAWESFSEEEKIEMGGSQPTAILKTDTIAGEEVSGVVYETSTGKMIDGEAIEALKEKYGVKDLKDIDKSKMTAEEKEEVGIAKLYEKDRDLLVIKRNERAKEASLDEEKTLNKVRAEVNELNKNPKHKVNIIEIEQDSQLLSSYDKSKKNIEKNKELKEKVELQEKVTEHQAKLVDNKILSPEKVPGDVLAASKEAASGITLEIADAGSNGNIGNKSISIAAANYQQDTPSISV